MVFSSCDQGYLGIAQLCPVKSLIQRTERNSQQAYSLLVL